jgi:hypothetical protein
MRISTEKVMSNGRTVGFAVNLKCRDEAEFLEAYNKIKTVDGVVWSGCPVEDEKGYMDMIGYVDKGEYTIPVLKDEAEYIAQQCKKILIA